MEWNQIPKINTKRLRIRTPSPCDAEAMLRVRSNILSDPARRLFMGPMPIGTLEQMGDSIAKSEEQFMANPSSLQLVILDSSDCLIGMCGLVRWSRPNKRSELFAMLDPSSEGHGFMLEALNAVLSLSIHSLGVHRLEAYIDKENIRSQKTAQNVGLKHEATLVDYWCYSEGNYRTAMVFSHIETSI